MEKGLIHIYHGDGKGKTTSAIGLSIRALGAGYKVIFVQFLKGGETSELKVLDQIDDVEIIRCQKEYGFTWELSELETEELKQEHIEIFEKVVEKCKKEDRKVLVVLDEICATYKLALMDKKAVIDFLEHHNDNLEIVMTGRNPEPELIAVADYISEIKKERHPLDAGAGARIGIEI